MNSKQIRSVLVITFAVALCWLTAPLWGGGESADPSIPQSPPAFDAEQAFRMTEEFVTQNPRRVLGSLEARQATGYLQGVLQRLGYTVSFSHFDAMVAGRRQAGRNIMAFRAGLSPGVIAVASHYDTARTTVQGATDNGAGVGVLLELARVFTVSPLQHSLLIVASDGGEWSLSGSADLAANYPGSRNIMAALSLDGVSAGELAELRLDTDGQRSGYTPPWLRRLALRAAGAQGLPVLAASGLREYFEHALAWARTDQGPFLNAGIPAINLGSGSADELYAREIYHSPRDTIANLKTESLRKYGAAAERILRAIDGLGAIPAGSMKSFAWKDDAFVSGWAATVLHILAFLPLFAMVAFGWVRCGRSLCAGTVLRETIFFLVWLAPFALFFSLILFFRLLKFLPLSGLYPAPLKDPILESPAWGLMTGILAGALVVGVALHFLVRFLTRGQPRSLDASRTLLMTFLLIVVVMALLYNSYWAVTFLAFPALVWGVVSQGRGAGGRTAGALAILAAGFMFYVMAVFAAIRLDAGWRILWYATLGLSSGMLQWQGYLLAASAMALGLRFLSLQFGGQATQFPNSSHKEV
jgi:hypothetical protein